MPVMHPAAASGFAREAQAYARGRHDYPAAIAAWLRDELGLSPAGTVLDLGAGTGKFTPYLAATGARVIAVEPVPAMAAELTLRFPATDARPGSTDALPLADASVDAVVCAQSFHWFATPVRLDRYTACFDRADHLGWYGTSATSPCRGLPRSRRS
jgi:SAM-dependent methyltransferase